MFWETVLAAGRIVLRTAAEFGWNWQSVTGLIIPVFALLICLVWTERHPSAIKMAVGETLRDALKPTAVVALVLWGILFGSLAARTIYLEHVELRNRADIATREWDDRINTVHADEPAYQNLMGAFRAFSEMRKILPHQKQCLILITNGANGRSNISVADMLTLGASMAGCISGGFNGAGDFDTPAARTAVAKEYSPDHVVIHASQDDKAAYVLADKLEQLTFVQKSETLLPWTPKGVIWVQVGADARWYRRN